MAADTLCICPMVIWLWVADPVITIFVDGVSAA